MLYTLSGQLDMDTCGELAKKLTAMLRQPAPLSLDFSAVETVDSAALALILELKREAQGQGQTLTLSALPRELHSLAKLYGIEALLPQIVKADE